MDTAHLPPLERLDQLLSEEYAGLDARLRAVGERAAGEFMDGLLAVLLREIRSQDPKIQELLSAVVTLLTKLAFKPIDKQRFAAMFAIGDYFHRIGQAFKAIQLCESLLPEARVGEDRDALRRLHNILAVSHTDIANYTGAMEHCEQALLIARELENPFLESAALANATRVLKQMGLYHDALAICAQVLAMNIDSEPGRDVRFQVCATGLFCAHRIRDHEAALRFLAEGGRLLNAPLVNPFNRAVFEHNRAHYLIDNNDAETAEIVLQAASEALRESHNPRVKLLLAIPAALCKWASGDWPRIYESRKLLKQLYRESRASLLNFDDVLRALLKVHSNAETPEVAQAGMHYAKELVEYTTNVRRAKFYRQLTEQGVPMEKTLARPFDPFANSRHWLSGATGAAPKLPLGPPVEKHEELNAIHEDLARLRTEAFRREIKTLAYATAENWALAAEFFDDSTGQHCFRVGYLAGMIAQELNLESAYCVQIEHAARLHDIGKIAVNEMILLKPGRLDPHELIAMRQHAQAGADMLQGTNDPTLKMAMTVAKYHHEWWNGTGYPQQLNFDRIPLPARITALADVYDALTNVRPYKTAWPTTAAIDEMVRLSGIQFDPNLIPAFLRVLKRYIPLLKSNALPGMRDMQHNALIQSRKNLMDTITGSAPRRK